MKYSAQQLREEDFAAIAEKCRIARGDIVTMTTLAASGHPGGSMSTIDFLLTLYPMINVDPTNPHLPGPDPVIFSPGCLRHVRSDGLFFHAGCHQPVPQSRQHL